MVKKIVVFFVFLIGLIMTFLIPPFAKPDEQVHFKKTLEIASGKIICQNGEKLLIKDRFNIIYDLSKKYGLAGHPVHTFPLSEYKIPIFYSSNNFLETKTEFCHFNSIGYLPQAIGIKIADILKLNGIVAFFLGRFINFIIIFWVIVFIAYKSNQFFWFFILPLSFPITLQQISAYSYDGMTILFFYLYFYFFLKKTQEKKIQNRIISIILLFFAVTTKNFFYFPFILLLIPDILFILKSVKKRSIKILIAITSLLGGAFFIYIFNRIFLPILTIEKNLVFKLINPQAQLLIIKNYPAYLLEIFFNNFYRKQNFFINSLIANLEWLHFELSSLITYIFFGLIIFLVMKKINYKIKKETISILLITTFIFVISIFIFLYLTWTPLALDEIEGFQGRYLIPIFPLILLILNQLRMTAEKIFVFLSSFLIFSLIAYNFYLRHYDYSKIINFPKKPLITKNTFDAQNNKNYQSIINLNQEKKLQAFFIAFSGSNPNPPFALEIYNPDCKKMLRYKIIPTGKLQMGDNIIFIKSLKNYPKVCLKINTFSLKYKDGTALKFQYLFEEKKEYLFYPIYNF